MSTENKAAAPVAESSSKEAPALVPGSAPDSEDGPLCMKVTTKNSCPFYIRSALSFLKGSVTKSGEKKPAMQELTISALGNAISVAIACASRVEETKIGTIEDIKTEYLKVAGGKSCAQIVVKLKRAANADDIELNARELFGVGAVGALSGGSGRDSLDAAQGYKPGSGGTTAGWALGKSAWRKSQSQALTLSAAERARQSLRALLETRAVTAFVHVSICASILSVVLETHFRRANGLWYASEIFFTIVFTLELAVRVFTTSERSKWAFVRKPLVIMDLLSILPLYLHFCLHVLGGGSSSSSSSGSSDPSDAMEVINVLRVFRIFRLIKILAHLNPAGLYLMHETLLRSTTGISILAFFLTVFLALFSSLMYYAEKTDCPTKRTFEDEVASVEAYEAICSVSSSGFTKELPILHTHNEEWRHSGLNLLDAHSYYESATTPAPVVAGASGSGSTSNSNAALQSTAVADYDYLAQLMQTGVIDLDGLQKLDPTPHQTRLCCNVDTEASDTFPSVLAAAWWSIVTMTTVGYGDRVPVTVWGKAVAMFTMLSGILVISMPAAIIGSKFQEVLEEYELRRYKSVTKEKPSVSKREVALRELRAGRGCGEMKGATRKSIQGGGGHQQAEAEYYTDTGSGGANDDGASCGDRRYSRVSAGVESNEKESVAGERGGGGGMPGARSSWRPSSQAESVGLSTCSSDKGQNFLHHGPRLRDTARENSAPGATADAPGFTFHVEAGAEPDCVEGEHAEQDPNGDVQRPGPSMVLESVTSAVFNEGIFKEGEHQKILPTRRRRKASVEGSKKASAGEEGEQGQNGEPGEKKWDYGVEKLTENMATNLANLGLIIAEKTTREGKRFGDEETIAKLEEEKRQSRNQGEKDLEAMDPSEYLSSAEFLNSDKSVYSFFVDPDVPPELYEGRSLAPQPGNYMLVGGNDMKNGKALTLSASKDRTSNMSNASELSLGGAAGGAGGNKNAAADGGAASAAMNDRLFGDLPTFERLKFEWLRLRYLRKPDYTSSSTRPSDVSLPASEVEKMNAKIYAAGEDHDDDTQTHINYNDTVEDVTMCNTQRNSSRNHTGSSNTVTFVSSAPKLNYTMSTKISTASSCAPGNNLNQNRISFATTANRTDRTTEALSCFDVEAMERDHDDPIHKLIVEEQALLQAFKQRQQEAKQVLDSIRKLEKEIGKLRKREVKKQGSLSMKLSGYYKSKTADRDRVVGGGEDEDGHGGGGFGRGADAEWAVGGGGEAGDDFGGGVVIVDSNEIPVLGTAEAMAFVDEKTESGGGSREIVGRERTGDGDQHGMKTTHGSMKVTVVGAVGCSEAGTPAFYALVK
eukprot:g8656.t1